MYKVKYQNVIICLHSYKQPKEKCLWGKNKKCIAL